MSQWQAASLLACSFFCLFPHRQIRPATRKYTRFPYPNFNTLVNVPVQSDSILESWYCSRLYQHGPENKISKLQCILHYFKRIATDSKYLAARQMWPSKLFSKFRTNWRNHVSTICLNRWFLPELVEVKEIHGTHACATSKEDRRDRLHSTSKSSRARFARVRWIVS